MSDFLGSLLFRGGISSAVQSAETTLQPRLPSLFESAGRKSDFPAPPPDRVARISMDSAQPSLGVEPKTDLLMNHPRNSAQLRSDSALVERAAQELRPHATPPSEITELSRVRPLDSSHSGERWRTILSDTDREAALQSEQNFLASAANGSSTIVQPAMTQAGDSEDVGHRSHLIVESEAEASMSEREPKLILAPQPVVADSWQSTAQSNQPPQQERVVEIHIGRIEVRAMPPPAPVRPTPQPKATMGLEEYLRKRAGEKT